MPFFNRSNFITFAAASLVSTLFVRDQKEMQLPDPSRPGRGDELELVVREAHITLYNVMIM